MAEEVFEEDDFDYIEEEYRRELLERVAERSVRENVTRALQAAEMNWHRHGDEDLLELRAILSVLGKLASKEEKPKRPLAMDWSALRKAVAEILEGVYTQAEVDEDLNAFRRLLDPTEFTPSATSVLPTALKLDEIRGVFLGVFGEVEQGRLEKLLASLEASCKPAPKKRSLLSRGL